MGRKVFIINCVLAIAFIAGCDWIPRVKYTRQVNLTVPAGQAELFTAKTHNGKITIKGSETTDCNLTATIIVRTDTEENAKKIAEQVKIDLIPEENSINVRIEKPDIPKWVQISVSLNANLPAGMNLSLETHNGEISSSSIVGRIGAVTHNGKITVTGAAGGADLLTHNGIINYAGALADLKFETHNGNVAINCTEQSPKPCDISIETHNGGIEFTAPENFSAAVDGSTHNGSIRTGLPLTVTSKNNKIIKGVIGSGRDKLHLKTYNGSIIILKGRVIDMFPQVLASLTVNSPDGGMVDLGSGSFVIEALPFIFLILVVVLVIWYKLTKKRLEHQQIMAAIEKGAPLSELRPVKQQKKEVDWIKNLTGGITCLLIGLGLIIIMLLTNKCIFGDNRVGLFIAAVLLAVGIARVIRGILQRKSALDANQGQ